MIILPKKLTTLVSAQDTKESEWDLEQFYQTCEKSLSWRGKDSAARTWKARLKRVFWMKHLFTQTLKPSLTESFEDSWISYLEDSRANHSLKQALKKLPKTQDTFSPTSQKESKSANLELFSSKMSKGYSVAKQEKENLWSNMSEEHWKKWVTEQRSEYSQRVKSASHIKEKESLSWATPRAGAIDNSRPNNKGGIPLGDQVKRNWSTPTTMDSANIQAKRKNHPGGGQKPPLCQEVKDFPTPTTRDWKGAYPKASQEKNPRNLLPDVAGENTLQDLMKNNTDGKPQGLLKLNPDWVENLMGIPQGWTDLEL